MRLVLTAVLSVVFALAAVAQQPQRHSEVEIFLAERAQLLQVVDLAELDHVMLDEVPGGWLVRATVGARELERLGEAGYAYDVIVADVVAEVEARSVSCPPSPPTGTPEGFFYGSLHCFPSFDETVAALDQMRAQYPNLITEKQSIGLSWQQRPVWMVRVSAAPDPEAVPEALYTALHHAREPGSLTSVLYFMYHLLENYGIDEEVTELLDNRALYFIPVLNPDGYVHVEQSDIMWRKNRRDNGGSFGVDLNRNYAFQWNCSWPATSCSPTSNTYAGPYPFSEPETQALRSWLQTREIRAAYNFHTHGRYWLHPFGFSVNVAEAQTPHHQQYTALGPEITRYNEYAYGLAGVVLYPAAGTADDWMYGEQLEKGKILGFTPEMGTSFWPPPSQIVPISRDALHPNLVLARAVGPYLSAVSVDIAEASAGNGYLDPGEVGLAHVEAFNLGLGRSEVARARVVSINPALGVEPGPWSPPFAFSGYETFEIPPLTFELAPDAPLGRHEGLEVEVEGDGVVSRFPLGSFTIGTPAAVFEDPIDDASNWTLGDWGLTAYAYSPPYALADSPGTLYPNHADNALLLAAPLDLSDGVAPALRFMARWDVQREVDFVQVLATHDGHEWTPLEGLHTRPGSGVGVQPAGEPGYDGTSNWWVQEEMSLAAFEGQAAVHLQWRLRSGAGPTAQGFFLDDVEVVVMTHGNPVAGAGEPADRAFWFAAAYPNPTRGAAHLTYRIAEPAEAVLAVYDLLGRRVRVLDQRVHEAGVHSVAWDTRDSTGRAVPAGTYLIQLRAGRDSAVQRVAVIR